jgi:hypothetical protein
MLVRFDEYISGGYFVTLYGDGISRNAWLRSVCHAPDDLLPERFLSVAVCGVPKAPTFSWFSGGIDEEYIAFGIPLERRTELEAWSDIRFDLEIGFPYVFWELATAREYVAKFSTTPDVVQILSIGLHRERLNLIDQLEQLRPPQGNTAGFKDNGFATALHRNITPAPGEMLGYDLICCDINIDHSWLCSDLSVEALNLSGFRPNGFGLIDDKVDADKLADHCNSPDEQAGEPGIWLPVLVTRYSTQVEE